MYFQPPHYLFIFHRSHRGADFCGCERSRRLCINYVDIYANDVKQYVKLITGNSAWLILIISDRLTFSLL